MKCLCPKCHGDDIGLHPEDGFDFTNDQGGFWMNAECYSCGENFLVWCELQETVMGE